MTYIDSTKPEEALDGNLIQYCSVSDVADKYTYKMNNECFTGAFLEAVDTGHLQKVEKNDYKNFFSSGSRLPKRLSRYSAIYVITDKGKKYALIWKEFSKVKD